MLHAEKVKAFRIFEPAERTVQHEETPQPPPLKPPGEEKPASEFEQQKADITFFTSGDAHFGQQVSFSVAVTR
ncbi:MAG: hypothetical protein M0Z60_14575 [Nitrospiraceae bacterium]|nr:hypothetical protein [Nitrospiraceae bacterium]